MTQQYDNMTMAKIIKVVNTNETLRNMRVGETVVLPFKDVSPVTVRANVSGLRKRESMDFKITQSTKECKSTVTRIK